MKSIVIVDYDMSVVGGTERVAANLANKLTEYYCVHLISVKQDGEKPAFQLNKEVFYHTMLGHQGRLRTTIMKFRKPFQKYVSDNNIDVILMIGDYVGAIVLPTKLQTKAKYIFCEHGALMNQWKEKDITFIRWTCSLFADKVITLTKSSRDSYIKKFHIKKSKVEYIYNWIDESSTAVVGPYDVTSKKIISVGRFDREKGQDLLVEVGKRILPLYPEWQWDVYGDGITFYEINALVKEYGLEDQLILKGEDTSVVEKYCQYGMFVLTSYREGLPLVLLEAKANHLPMISFDILTGPKEIIHDNMDGYLIPPYSVEQMVEKMCYLMEHEEVRYRFSKNTEMDMDQFLQTSILKLWCNLIDSI